MNKYHWLGHKTFVDVTTVATAFLKDKVEVRLVTHPDNITTVPFESEELARAALRDLFNACKEAKDA